MATEVLMPQMGYDMTEGTVVKWVKQEGDAVSKGEVIAEIETDKATVEMEAEAGGVLRRIAVGEGATACPSARSSALSAPPTRSFPRWGTPPLTAQTRRGQRKRPRPFLKRRLCPPLRTSARPARSALPRWRDASPTSAASISSK